MNRRRFLELFGSLVAVSAFPTVPVGAREVSTDPLEGSRSEVVLSTPEWIDLAKLTPNPAANLVNMVVVPERLYPRTNREAVKMAVDFRTTFNSEDPTVLNHDLWGYGQSVREALQRGQTVWLVLDLPNDFSVDLNSLKLYFETLARKFTVMDSRGSPRTARFVIGNELNASERTSTETYLYWYAQAYLTAVDTIRSVNPLAEVYPASDAYFGKVDVLSRILQKIAAADTQQRDLDSLVDGLCFHFYDNCSKLAARAQLYAAIAQEFSLDPAELHLLELGKGEMNAADFSSYNHQVVIIRNLVTALALHHQGVLKTCFWHTAEYVGDPNGHALFIHEGDRFEPKPQYYTFELISKLLYRITTFEERQLAPSVSEVVCQSETSGGDQVTISWRRFRNLAGEITNESEPIVTFGMSGRELSRREVLMKPWKPLFGE